MVHGQAKNLKIVGATELLQHGYWDLYLEALGLKFVNTKLISDGMLGWIDNYCQANPLERIDDAAVKLDLELEKLAAGNR